MTQHIHLDLVGGCSGDMFIGAMLDSFPALAEGLQPLLSDAGFPDMVRLEHQAHNDGMLSGTRFSVLADTEAQHHRHYTEIVDLLSRSALSIPSRETALKLFQYIAEAEAQVHGKPLADIGLHEVGAWDSIADIVLAAHLIQASGVQSWSVSRVPIGRGFISSAHGTLPVPAPAVSLLLEGFAIYDDGLEGERVTPTGAAILKYLAPTTRVPAGMTLAQSGYGFGARQFPGLSNTLRVLVFNSLNPQEDIWDEEQVIQLSFELDDQTPESIARGLDKIRMLEDVLDVTQVPYWGKKNRQGVSVSILVSSTASAEREAIAACFSETTSLGIRRESIRRMILPRQEVTVTLGENAYRVKVVRRPTGITAKVEMDDLAAADLDQAAREAVQREAAAKAIRLVTEDADDAPGK